MVKQIYPWLIAFLLVGFANVAGSQSLSTANPAQTPCAKLLFLQAADTLHKGRLWLAAGSGAALYGGISVALWNAWYKDFPLGRFHTFNDWREWNGMDKSGHLFSAFIESNYSWQALRWTGVKRRSARWIAAGIGIGLQTTIEVMDGFSQEWGFSWGDMTFNAVGAGLFVAQDLLWQEQRILIKASGKRPAYSKSALFDVEGITATTLERRASELYGDSPFEVILKDYNALTVWASVNLSSFDHRTQPSGIPAWLNVAVGYGAGNIYGGFLNEWTDEQDAEFVLSGADYPRYRQFYLAPDVDLTRIQTRHRWLRFALGVLNWIKMPAPAIEYNTLGRIKFHWLYW